METRLRELLHNGGPALRLIAASDAGAIARLWLGWHSAHADPLALEKPQAAMLAAYLLAARLALPDPQPEDELPGFEAIVCTVVLAPHPCIRLAAGDCALAIPEALWDRLYAELLLTLAWLDGTQGALAAHRAALAHARSIAPALLH